MVVLGGILNETELLPEVLTAGSDEELVGEKLSHQLLLVTINLNKSLQKFDVSIRLSVRFCDHKLEAESEGFAYLAEDRHVNCH